MGGEGREALAFGSDNSLCDNLSHNSKQLSGSSIINSNYEKCFLELSSQNSYALLL